MTQQLTKIEKDLPRFLSLTITDQPTLQEASTYLVGAKKEYKALKADMDTLLDPIKESIDLIKEKYDPRLKALKGVIDTLTSKTSDYATRIANEAQAKAQAISDRVKPGTGNLSVEKATERMGNIQQLEKKVETEAGGMQFVAYPTFEVMDLTMLPIEYHLADEVAIRREMKSGNKLPGVRYFTEQRPKNSR
uniref:Uncharacterized protein n=1 Tax=uncultured marine virus TaxID=186617 RepID=A0A0F7L769_9VIRU|nr:hypothetical protein [uncultured marine virus]